MADAIEPMIAVARRVRRMARLPFVARSLLRARDYGKSRIQREKGKSSHAEGVSKGPRARVVPRAKLCRRVFTQALAALEVYGE